LHFDPVGDGANNTGNAITFGASDSSSGTNANAGIYTRSDGTYGTKMYFATTDSYASGSKARMMIDYNGNVGIGTTSPNAKLEVSDGDIYLDDGYEIRWDNNGRVTAGEELVLKAGSNDSAILLDGSDSAMYFRLGSTAVISIRDGYNVGIGTTSPAASAKLTVIGNQTFGLPGNGSNTSGRFISIEGNTDSSGEGSSRIFFTEHNSTTASMDNYGMSIGYRGGGASITGASGNDWTGLSQIGNGEWGMWGHDNNATGALIMRGDRAATYINFGGNNLTGIGSMYVADAIYHEGDTNTYIQFIANDTIRWVTGGVERMRLNSVGRVGIGSSNPGNKLYVTDSRAGANAPSELAAIHGYNSSTDTSSANSVGVAGTSLTTSGKAIYGNAPNGGWGGYFNGKGFLTTR
jgi:hypothetical protein